MDVRPGSVAWPREKAHLLQEVSRRLDSLSIRVVQSVDVESVEIAEYTMLALFELMLHRKRLANHGADRASSGADYRYSSTYGPHQIDR